MTATTNKPNKHLFIAKKFKPLIALVVVAAIFLFAVSQAADNSSLYSPYINQFRAQTGAGPLSYSESLFQQSWRNAHSIVTQHNCQLQHLGGNGGSSGETIYWGSPGSNWAQETKQAIDDWQQEGPPSSGINHYSIMHDPQYKHIGCATDVPDWKNHANGCGFVVSCNFN